MRKENVIVSLGRFISTDTKNHAIQLKLFREFLSRNGGHWTLILIGFCTESEQDRAYFEQLRQAAEGLPVVFVVNANRQSVFERLAEAKIFWHTTALCSSINVSPSSMEHFGIATVEAMAAGCVPIVPLSGGQPEIVQHGVNGFLCRDIEDLLRNTSLLCHDDTLRQAMAQRARERSRQFGPTAFAQEWMRIISDVWR
jgi:glycosyltransferase involved in cell wall biosynthesis